MSEAITSGCLVIAATPIELAGLLEILRSQRNESINRMAIDVLITGVGLTATSYALTRQLQLKRPDFVIQAGVAGCFNREIALGSVFLVKKDCIADQAVIENRKLKTLFDLSLARPNKPPYRNGWLVNNSGLLKKTGLKQVSAISVNEITTSKQKIGLFREKFNPVLESLEGAALHYVCNSEQIPFIQLRAVSNYLGERNKKKWLLEQSVQNLNMELIRLLNNI